MSNFNKIFYIFQQIILSNSNLKVLSSFQLISQVCTLTVKLLQCCMISYDMPKLRKEFTWRTEVRINGFSISICSITFSRHLFRGNSGSSSHHKQAMHGANSKTTFNKKFERLRSVVALETRRYSLFFAWHDRHGFAVFWLQKNVLSSNYGEISNPALNDTK